jgi:hypothetical protein
MKALQVSLESEASSLGLDLIDHRRDHIGKLVEVGTTGFPGTLSISLKGMASKLEVVVNLRSRGDSSGDAHEV